MVERGGVHRTGSSSVGGSGRGPGPPAGQGRSRSPAVIHPFIVRTLDSAVNSLVRLDLGPALPVMTAEVSAVRGLGSFSARSASVRPTACGGGPRRRCSARWHRGRNTEPRLSTGRGSSFRSAWPASRRHRSIGGLIWRGTPRRRSNERRSGPHRRQHPPRQEYPQGYSVRGDPVGARHRGQEALPRRRRDRGQDRPATRARSRRPRTA